MDPSDLTIAAIEKIRESKPHEEDHWNQEQIKDLLKEKLHGKYPNRTLLEKNHRQNPGEPSRKDLKDIGHIYVKHKCEGFRCDRQLKLDILLDAKVLSFLPPSKD